MMSPTHPDFVIDTSPARLATLDAYAAHVLDGRLPYQEFAWETAGPVPNDQNPLGVGYRCPCGSINANAILTRVKALGLAADVTNEGYVIQLHGQPGKPIEA